MKIQRLLDTVKSCKRNHKKSKLDELRAKNFDLPTARHQMQTLNVEEQEAVHKLAEGTKQVISENQVLKRTLAENDEENDILHLTLANLESKSDIIIGLLHTVMQKHRQCLQLHKSDMYKMQREMNQWQDKYEDIDTRLDSVMQEREKLRKKRLKMRDNIIDKQKTEKKELTATLSNVTAMMNNIQNDFERNIEQLESTKKKKISLQKQISALKQSNFHAKSTVKLSRQIKTNEGEIANLQQINELMEADCVTTFADGKYTNEVRECVMTLMTECNISTNKMSKVITTVLEKLAGKHPERLPSKGLLSRLMIEAKVLASNRLLKQWWRQTSRALKVTAFMLREQPSVTGPMKDAKYRCHQVLRCQLV